ncbi:MULTISPECIES: glycerate kinase [Thermoactinomyces]|jgi:glycerate 2-kinase|uniref:glycerate kinase n=1 Tax=Thermoactinomyces TaxID=2023 RepID=UPI00050057DF|nr:MULTISPECIES: glycerate kinase [Thermoactinomyces]KFZ40037.1 glycerate kinase [Thermoactinomyces sp. Gus2-1]MBH8584505.1 glycerate kinase [Thermoactinomyces sp. CICC 10735]QBK12712.1 glycerate kinase [Thermoactinomyces vulgaris]QCV56448.1 glycerate kinase [Thermoactinomyces vulgaris]
MKIVIAPDSFKESMSAMEAACAIEKGFQKVMPDAEYVKVPMADGGEGTVRSMVDATGGEIRKETVTGPLGTEVEAFYGITGDRKMAVIEMAAASGIHLVPKEKRNPLVTTTKGTGELIRAALDQGVKRIVIGIGGSATNDGGAGMAQALGAKLLDKDGNPLGVGGGELSKLDSIDLSQLDPRLKEVHIEVACDVDHPLTGERGASAVFGPQKGATPEMVAILDANLARYAQVVKETLGIDVDPIPGAGAAGGLGAGLVAFLGASLKRGVDVVAEAVQLDKHMVQASLVITGEGKIDGQTIHGKTPVGVAKRAKKYGIPVIGIAGMLGENCDAVYRHGIDALFSIVPGTVSLETALLNGEKYTEQLAGNLARLIRLKQMVDGTGAD